MYRPCERVDKLRYADQSSILGFETKLGHTIEEVRFEIYIKDVPAQTLDRIVEWQDMHTFSVFDIQTLMYMDHIAEFDSQVVTSNLVHLDFAFLYIIGAQADENCISPFFSPVES